MLMVNQIVLNSYFYEGIHQRILLFILSLLHHHCFEFIEIFPCLQHFFLKFMAQIFLFLRVLYH